MTTKRPAPHLTTGLRCRAAHAPGVIVARDGDITVRLDSGATVRCLPAEVCLDDHEALCSYCQGAGDAVACEECSGAGAMACCYCGGIADAGHVSYLTGAEWRCSDCDDQINPGDAAPAVDYRPYLGKLVDPDGEHSWRGGL